MFVRVQGLCARFLFEHEQYQFVWKIFKCAQNVLVHIMQDLFCKWKIWLCLDMNNVCLYISW